jgi:hypothetical protein
MANLLTMLATMADVETNKERRDALWSAYSIASQVLEPETALAWGIVPPRGDLTLVHNAQRDYVVYPSDLVVIACDEATGDVVRGAVTAPVVVGVRVLDALATSEQVRVHMGNMIRSNVTNQTDRTLRVVLLHVARWTGRLR